MPTHGFSIKPLKVKLLAGEQKATANYTDRQPSDDFLRSELFGRAALTHTLRCLVLLTVSLATNWVAGSSHLRAQNEGPREPLVFSWCPVLVISSLFTGGLPKGRNNECKGLISQDAHELFAILKPLVLHTAEATPSLYVSGSLILLAIWQGMRCIDPIPPKSLECEHTPNTSKGRRFGAEKARIRLGSPRRSGRTQLRETSRKQPEAWVDI